MGVYQNRKNQEKRVRAECIGRIYAALGIQLLVPAAPATRRYDNHYGRVINLGESK